jgi:biopolymer transport protein ExbD
MSKVKMSKKATSIDMTAMCDVAFLLLTFFILTATTKLPEALPVDTPSSTTPNKLPERDLATIIIGGKDKVFFGVLGKDVRERTLALMGLKYGVTFTEEQSTKFSKMDNFGVPIEGLASLIDMKPEERNRPNVQPGIPKDSLNNQLKEWIYNARIATIEDSNKERELNIAIKGDAKEQYPVIKRVMDILQDQQINNFSLITGLKGKDF